MSVIHRDARAVPPCRTALAPRPAMAGLLAILVVSASWCRPASAEPDPSALAFAHESVTAHPGGTIELAQGAPNEGLLAAKRTRRSRARSARIALVMDAKSGEVLYERNAARRVPVASLTKLMTAIIFLETNPNLDDRVTVAREDLRGSGRTQLRRGEIVRVRDLLYHSLMSSDNAATKTLVRVSGIGSTEFLRRMNRKASVYGLSSTRFVEFTGLDARNVSSAADMAELLRHALRVPMIARITSEPEYQYRSKSHPHHLVNTNRLVRFSKLRIKGGKTGYINAAGYCLVTWIQHRGRDLVTVVLGAASNPARFSEAQQLVHRALSSSAAAEEDLGAELPASAVGE